MTKFVNWLVILVSFKVIAISCAFNVFRYCEYINGEIDSVQLICFGEDFVRSSKCQTELSNDESNELQRSQVKYLKVMFGSVCDNKDTAPLDAFFWNIRILDYSRGATSTFHSNMKFHYLEVFNAAHNEVGSLSSDIFDGQPNLQQIDFSFNYITTIEDGTFDANLNLSMINLAHNSLTSIERNTFAQLVELKVLELNSNLIKMIDENAFEYNSKLERLHLQDNPLVRFDCHLFLPLNNLVSLIIAVNDSDSLKDVRELDLSCDDCSSPYQVDVNNPNSYVVRLTQVMYELGFDRNRLATLQQFSIAGKQLQNITGILNLLGEPLEMLDLTSNHLAANTFDRFIHLKELVLSDTNLSIVDVNPFQHQTELNVLDISENNLANVNFTLLSKTFAGLIGLNVASCQIQNVSEVLELLSPSVEMLNLAFNHIESIEESTFQRFIHLQSLNLSHTHLKEFGFLTFFHLTRLISLDLSANNWNAVDFSLFIRRFNELHELRLENNLLQRIDGLTPEIFPTLHLLDISGNAFSCTYLAKLLHNWPKLHLVHNPTRPTHIDGVNCIFNDSNENNLI